MQTKLLVCCLVVALSGVSANASELKPDTAVAFDQYIRATEVRMEDDVRNDQFLVIDRLPDAGRDKAYDQLQHGQIYIEELHTHVDGRTIRIPHGLIHHWAGVIFIPGGTLSEVVAVLQDYDHHQIIYKPDVRRSKLIEQNGNESKIYLQFFSKSIVTVVVNADFDVSVKQLGSSRFESASRSTRIAEVSHLGKADEHELPVGKDRGYMWRLNSYWRVDEKDGGTYVQNESIALTRTIPGIFAWLVNPLTKSIPRDVLLHLLTNTRRSVQTSAN